MGSQKVASVLFCFVVVDNSRVNIYRLNPVLSGEVSELAEGARLETVYGGNVIEGSNPSLSAIAGR